MAVYRRVYCQRLSWLPEFIREPGRFISNRRSGFGGYYQAVNPGNSYFTGLKRWYPEQWRSAGHVYGQINNDNVFLRMYKAERLITVREGLCIHLGPEGLNVDQNSFWDTLPESVLTEEVI